MNSIYEFLEFMAVAITIFAVLSISFIAINAVISVIIWGITKFFGRIGK